MSGLVDIAIGGPECFHDLPHVKAATLDRGPAPSSSFSKGYARMPLPAQAFIEQRRAKVRGLTLRSLATSSRCVSAVATLAC